jgi:hypothetical protein
LVVGTLSSIRIWRCTINTPRILMQQVTIKTFSTQSPQIIKYVFYQSPKQMTVLHVEALPTDKKFWYDCFVRKVMLEILFE